MALPGHAWIVVRAERLAPETIVAALQKGSFYASNGITLEDYAVNANKISITIKQTTRRYGPPPVTRFLTRFIGKGGRILAEVAGLNPRYTIRGDEAYVRVSIIDSNGQRAWTQPIFLEASGDLGTVSEPGQHYSFFPHVRTHEAETQRPVVRAGRRVRP